MARLSGPLGIVLLMLVLLTGMFVLHVDGDHCGSAGCTSSRSRAVRVGGFVRRMISALSRQVTVVLVAVLQPFAQRLPAVAPQVLFEPSPTPLRV